MFGYETICWPVMGSIILLRLFTQPAPPTPLMPHHLDRGGPARGGGSGVVPDLRFPAGRARAGLAGYAVLMVLVQVRLIPVYRRVPFGPG
jgi:tellurite resistance protein